MPESRAREARNVPRFSLLCNKGSFVGQTFFGCYLVRKWFLVWGMEAVLEMVARDGIAQHYGALTIPLIGVHLYPALELR